MSSKLVTGALKVVRAQVAKRFPDKVKDFGEGWVGLASAAGMPADWPKTKHFAMKWLCQLFDPDGRLAKPQRKRRKVEPKRSGKPPSPASDAFLGSYEWRVLRMKVLTKYGSRCMCCGATPDDGVKMHVDHIKPRKLFPDLALTFDNLQVLCEVCNHGKGNWDMTDWRTKSDPVSVHYSDEAIEQMLRNM